MVTWPPDFQAYNGPVQPGPPPPPPQYPRGTEVNRIFERLKWSVLDSPSRVEIFSLDSEDNPQWTPLSTEPIADEAATNPPRSHLQIKLQPLDSWEHWQQAQQEPPKQLLIENTDGQPISVKQFIQAVHDYAVPLRRLLCKSCDLYGREEEAHARFYFECTMGVQESGTPDNLCTRLQVLYFEDTDEDGRQLADHLKFAETFYRNQFTSK